MPLTDELRGTDNDEPPSWTGQYHLPREQALVDELGNANERLEAALREVDTTQVALLQRQRLKRLFYATGAAFESAVRAAFESLGCVVDDGPPNRTDFIVRCGDRVAVIEAKGVGGSAAERNSAQLEKWVSEYIEAHEVHPKPVLIVNAFRSESTLGQRSIAFPHQMLDYATKREHCLITGLQLLGAVLDVESAPTKRAGVVDSIFDTVGIWQHYQQSSEFLNEGPEDVEPDREGGS